ncbi:hypothetical protein HGRIS_006486 [Hohenbuehelia grisea]|uniref:Superoxide dismutase [Cu-Zn] n=1 Tax=Hohenbuehelia grisea TaxID=104357 RepID=A0ABR3K310_9AGAR
MKLSTIALAAALSVAQLVSAGPYKRDVEADRKATVALFKDGNPKSEAIGTVTFSQAGPNSTVQITGTLKGLSPNAKRGFHIHQYADFSKGCLSAGGHFNPTKKQHGAPTDEDRHVGDLGNIQTDKDGVATLDFMDHVISLYEPNAITTHSVVLHYGEDDLGKGQGAKKADSQKTGNAGGRHACGPIVQASD